MLKTPQPPAKLVTYEEYEAWSREHGEVRAEWVNGEIIIHMSVQPIHQILVAFLQELIGLFIKLNRLGIVLTGPAEARLNDSIAREPDIFFIANEQLNQLDDKRFLGAPALAIEIISADSVNRDRVRKFREYQAAGVKEYWVVDPRAGKQRVDFFQLDEFGEYELVGTEDSERIDSVAISGLWIRPAWLWQTDRLIPFVRLAEILGVSGAELGERLEQLENGQ